MQIDVRAKTFFQAAAIVGGLLTVGACVVWATWAGNRPRTLPAGGSATAAETVGNPATPRSPAASAAAEAVHVGNALGADEQRVRDYIIDHEDDAKSVEFASWGPHDLKGEVRAKGYPVLRVRYRSKDGLGAMRLHDVLAYISDFDGAIRVNDNLGGDDWLVIHRQMKAAAETAHSAPSP